MAFVHLEVQDAVALLTLTSPESRNAFSSESDVQEFVDALGQIEVDRSVKAVIVTGEGSSFSAGGNIKHMLSRSKDGSVEPVDDRHRYRMGIQRLPLAMDRLEIPAIAAINGPAMGVGLDLACMCDIRIASETAVLAESFVKLGIIPGDGGAWLLQRVVGWSTACEMSFTGDKIDAAQALRVGLVSKVVAPADLLPSAFELAQRIARNPGEALRMTKRLMREARQVSLATLLELSASFQALAHFTQDHRSLVQVAVDRTGRTS